MFAAAALVLPQLEPVRKPALIVYSLFSVVLWARSLLVNWAGDGSLPFKLVHTVLALGFFVLAVWAYGFATSSVPAHAPAEVSSSHPDPGS
jgi:hypothetical protein